MPPRSIAFAAAVEAVASPTLRRSSRRSIPVSMPCPQLASASSLASVSTASSTSAPPAKRQRIKVEPETEVSLAPPAASATSSSKSRTKRTVKTEDVSTLIKAEIAEACEVKPAPKKRRTKKDSDPEEIFPPRPSPNHPLINGQCRTEDRRGSGIFIGAHISSAGGVENAPLNALLIGGNAFSCFVRPKMQWASNPISDTSAERFKQRVVEHGFMPSSSHLQSNSNMKQENEEVSDLGNYGYVVPHGCYLVNLANPALDKREKSFEAFIDDLTRCEQLGIRLFNFHPGSMTAASSDPSEPPPAASIEPLSSTRAAKADACKLVAEYINQAHTQTSSVTILIENMAGSKNDTILGSSLHDLSTIISHVTNKSRVGVCLDTCHAFAAGYDLRTPETYTAFVAEIENTIGWEKVMAFHLNDSKFGLGCKRDRHENVGRGHIGLGGFWNVVNDERWNGIPLILETPSLGNAVGAYPAKEGTKKMHEVWSYQIQALYALRGTKWGQWEEAEEWLTKADLVIAEAEKLYAAKKGAKAQGVAKKGKAKAKKKADSEDEEEESALSTNE